MRAWIGEVPNSSDIVKTIWIAQKQHAETGKHKTKTYKNVQKMRAKHQKKIAQLKQIFTDRVRNTNNIFQFVKF